MQRVVTGRYGRNRFWAFVLGSPEAVCTARAERHDGFIHVVTHVVLKGAKSAENKVLSQTVVDLPWPFVRTGRDHGMIDTYPCPWGFFTLRLAIDH